MSNNMYHYATVSKALEELKAKGYTVDYNLKENDIVECPNNYEITHIYRYEGQSDPGDEATVYGIKSDKGDLGVFVAGDLSFEEKSATRTLHELSIKDRQKE